MWGYPCQLKSRDSFFPNRAYPNPMDHHVISFPPSKLQCFQASPIFRHTYFIKIIKVHLPSGYLTEPWKITIFNGKTHYKWPCSMAMLNNQRVNHLKSWYLPMLTVSNTTGFNRRAWPLLHRVLLAHALDDLGHNVQVLGEREASALNHRKHGKFEV